MKVFAFEFNPSRVFFRDHILMCQTGAVPLYNLLDMVMFTTQQKGYMVRQIIVYSKIIHLSQ